jgi:hypothetical protein
LTSIDCWCPQFDSSSTREPNKLDFLSYPAHVKMEAQPISEM